MDQMNNFKKAAIGGYDKKSVLEYIYELNNNTQQAQDKLMNQIDELTASREKLSDSLKEMEKKLSGVQKERDNVVTELENERGRTDDLNGLIDSLNAEMRKQERIIAERDAEIAEHIRLNEELREKNEVLESKKQEVERASAYIGELLIKTRTESDSIIAQATSQSEVILSQAAQQAEELVVEAGKSLDGIYDQFSAFRAEMDVIRGHISASIEAVQEHFNEITTTVDKAETTLREFCRPSTVELKLITDTDMDTDDAVLPADELDDEFFRSAAEN